MPTSDRSSRAQRDEPRIGAAGAAPRSAHDDIVDPRAEYYYRRPLGFRELLPAVGVAIGAGLFAFYITRLLLERTPLQLDRGPRTRGDVERRPRA